MTCWSTRCIQGVAKNPAPIEEEPILPIPLKLFYDVFFGVVWLVISAIIISGQGRPIVSWGDGGSPDPTPLADARLVGLTFLLPPVVTAVFFVRHFARGGFRTVLTSVCLVGAIGWVLAAVALLAQ